MYENYEVFEKHEKTTMRKKDTFCEKTTMNCEHKVVIVLKPKDKIYWLRFTLNLMIFFPVNNKNNCFTIRGADVFYYY